MKIEVRVKEWSTKERQRLLTLLRDSARTADAGKRAGLETRIDALARVIELGSKLDLYASWSEIAQLGNALGMTLRDESPAEVSPWAMSDELIEFVAKRLGLSYSDAERLLIDDTARAQFATPKKSHDGFSLYRGRPPRRLQYVVDGGELLRVMPGNARMSW